MGKPTTYVVSCNEFIVTGSEPRELKYLSTWRKGNHRDSLSSDERTGTRPMAKKQKLECFGNGSHSG